MNRQEYWGALGSIQLFRVYWARWLVARGYAKKEFNEFGCDDFDVAAHFPVAIKELVEKKSEFFIDPRAFKEYEDLVQRVRSRGARIVGIIPPVELTLWKLNGAAYSNYYAKITPLFHVDEPVIDLNDPKFDQFRATSENFQDGVHLSSSAAKEVMDIINVRLKQM